MLEEGSKIFCALLEIVRSETPHVHGTEIVCNQLHVCLACERVVSIYLSVSLSGDVQVLYDVGKMLLLVISADASGYAA